MAGSTHPPRWLLVFHLYRVVKSRLTLLIKSVRDLNYSRKRIVS